MKQKHVCFKKYYVNKQLSPFFLISGSVLRLACYNETTSVKDEVKATALSLHVPIWFKFTSMTEPTHRHYPELKLQLNFCTLVCNTGVIVQERTTAYLFMRVSEHKYRTGGLAASYSVYLCLTQRC